MFPSRPFYFLRHGQTDWNVEGRLQGHTDVPLNPTGLAQAHSAALKLQNEPITRIITSPLVRALKTAAVTAENTTLPLHVCATLKERGFGSYEGRLSAQIRTELNLPATTPLPPPQDGEEWPATLHRARTSISSWLEKYPADIILFVGHGAFFRAMAEGMLGERLEAANATPYHFTPTAHGGWQMRTL